MRPELEEILRECGKFRGGFSTVLMATVSVEGRPEASYAPYVTDTNGAFFVYLSELSQHTANLQHAPRASLLFIENEEDAGHLFARRRLTLRCGCTPIPRDSAPWTQVMGEFKERFGELVDVLRGLDDFHLFRLQPEAGTYVRGFAQAYELSGPDLQAIRHINDKGHRPRSSDVAQRQAEFIGGD